jgi:hypothetical protein
MCHQDSSTLKQICRENGYSNENGLAVTASEKVKQPAEIPPSSLAF